MAQPPITKKPIPVTVAKWRAEVEGIRRFLLKLNGMYRDNGADWVRAQRDYYRVRMDDLLDNAPPSLVRTGEARQPRARS